MSLRKRLFVAFWSCAVMALVLVRLASADGGPDTAALLSKLQWRCVGPWIGGRVVAVAGVPGRNLFYMGAVGGGLWKSTNYGVTWVNISDGTLPSSSGSIGAIAVAPSDPKIVYAGMGESDIRGDVITGDGIYKSSDGGKSWRRIDTTAIRATAPTPKAQALS